MALQGTNLEIADYDGRTALHVAAAEGNFGIVRYLVEKANVSINPKDRFVFMLFFIIFKHFYILKTSFFRVFYFLEDIQYFSDDYITIWTFRWGHTPIDEARTFRHEKVQEYLMGAYAKSLSDEIDGAMRFVWPSPIMR